VCVAHTHEPNPLLRLDMAANPLELFWYLFKGESLHLDYIVDLYEKGMECGIYAT